MSAGDLPGGDDLFEEEPEKPDQLKEGGDETNSASEYPEEEGEGGYIPIKLLEEIEHSVEEESSEGAEEEEEDLFGEESWTPCEEKPQLEIYGEGEEGSLKEEEVEGEEEEEEEESIEEKISLDSEYLKSSLGTPLTYALLDIIAKRPTDPIHYLGHYLIKWRANNENKTKFEEEVKLLTVQREKHMMKTREKERQKMLAKEQSEEGRRRSEKTESSMGDEDLSSGSYEEDDMVMSEKGSLPRV